MSGDSNRAFRDYATRVSFNMTLSRNQIAMLRHVVFELENAQMPWQKRLFAASDAGCGAPSMHIVGHRSLETMGLIVRHPLQIADDAGILAAGKKGERCLRKYWGPTYALTEAGEHVVELLRIAGLMPQRAANTNKRRKSA